MALHHDTVSIIITVKYLIRNSFTLHYLLVYVSMQLSSYHQVAVWQVWGGESTYHMNSVERNGQHKKTSQKITLKKQH